MKNHPVDKIFLTIVIGILAGGLTIFYSASLGIFAKKGGDVFSGILMSQLGLGLLLGSIACALFSYIPYRFWRAYAMHVFLATLALTALVFVPGLGGESGGAKRWIYLGPISIQPSELLKLGFVIYLAAFLSHIRGTARASNRALYGFLAITGAVALLVVTQPDTGTFGVMFFAGIAMLLVSGVPWRHIGIIFVLGILALGLLAVVKPHVADRITTFMHPERDAQGSGYQIQQSLTAIGSGEVVGRGFGKSLQKFYYLPEPVGDSIFAVAAEEFGFVGSVAIILAFLFYAGRGLVIAQKAPDQFSGLLVVGIVILIISQAFLNIMSMLGIFPLTGVPLPFISHGGTALLMVLAGAGIILNVSRFARTT
ncbi:MAG: hypothetical protein A2591_03850 [Candidatus Yonathbacteria bacterium RIFOXYD1_FULL_52_36]|uniref:Probable peptidoglycan glycosyltransferase FtsW n=1 Tax=Candidatus Yonathbacteria bacterium RIFOXYD1_FULL_52_36 TaxID=1802730 RepID=A0A1G2SNB6_9BACT|nr:MAG: hypothetical protein A2591_03850 [Candidatus Yonathbacteria bacterium RIFOXYD1_FULL_52_36]